MIFTIYKLAKFSASSNSLCSFFKTKESFKLSPFIFESEYDTIEESIPPLKKLPVSNPK